jgi:multisubunit Na+/H+ antiporter MnhF subunit
MSPGIMLLIGLLLVLYGLIVGGTWVRRTPENIWDTASTIIFTIIAYIMINTYNTSSSQSSIIMVI